MGCLHFANPDEFCSSQKVSCGRTGNLDAANRHPVIQNEWSAVFTHGSATVYEKPD